MRTINTDNASLISQFNIKNDWTSIMDIIDVIENIFREFGYLIKKFYYSKNHKVYSPSYNKFKCINNYDTDVISGMSFQSDFNKKDFEPNTRLDIEVNMRYINSKNIVKISVVINDNFLLNDIYSTYKKIIVTLSENSDLFLSGYSFLLPNYYGAVSFSSGILRKLNMPCALKNLAGWYANSDLINSTICLMNCFSDLSDDQNQCLVDIFGKDNVFRINNVTAFINPFAENIDIADYIISDNYNEICNMLEQKLPFKRLTYHKER